MAREKADSFIPGISSKTFAQALNVEPDVSTSSTNKTRLFCNNEESPFSSKTSSIFFHRSNVFLLVCVSVCTLRANKAVSIGTCMTEAMPLAIHSD